MFIYLFIIFIFLFILLLYFIYLFIFFFFLQSQKLDDQDSRHSSENNSRLYSKLKDYEGKFSQHH